MTIKILVLLLITSFSLPAMYAQTKLPSFFGDNMVLQQKDSVTIWGTDVSNRVITVTGSWGSSAHVTADVKGQWRVKLATIQAGGPYTVTIKGSRELVFQNVLLGEVWFCSGQSNMEMPMKGFAGQPIIGSNEAIVQSRNDQIRFFHTPKIPGLAPVTDVISSWKKAEPANTPEFSAAAYFFAKKVQSVLGIPVGIIQSSWGASTVESWMDKQALASFPHAIIPDTLPKITPNKEPTIMFNAMLHPYIGYTIKGALWYQGEANRENAHQYQALLSAMIQSWRAYWKQGDFPFYFVQIAPFEMGKFNAALLREAQLKTMQSVPNTGMVVTLDIGERTVIHPAQKEQVGNRLAYWALAKTYQIKGIAFAGPTVKTAVPNKEGKMILSFENCTNGLTSFEKPLTQFEIAGEDSVFHPAIATISRDNPKIVVVWSEQVKNPKTVRYGFKSWTDASLFNTEGLPASSFRTDNW